MKEKEIIVDAIESSLYLLHQELESIVLPELKEDYLNAIEKLLDHALKLLK